MPEDALPPVDELDADLADLNAENEPEPKVIPKAEPKDEEVEEKHHEETDEEHREEPVLTRASFKDVNTKYPNLFKDFPELREAFFREQKFSEVFPTVEDAQEASEKASTFDNLEGLVFSGKKEDLTSFLEAVEEGRRGSLSSMAANFLPALYSTNQELYFQITGPIIDNIIKAAYQEGKKLSNENLMNAAEHLAHYAFGDADFASGTKTAPGPKVSSADPELAKERTQFEMERYQTMHENVASVGAKYLINDIKKDLDPNSVFNDWMKDRMVKDIFEEIDHVLEGDEQHMKNMNALWKRAAKAGYRGDWEDRIRSAYLSRARAVMPAIRSRIRKEALAQKERESSNREEIAGRSSGRREIPSAGVPGPRGSGNRTPGAKSVDWSKTSDLDFLNGKISTRG